MEQRTTFVPVPHPVVLAVGCRGTLLARCREATARISVGLATGDLLSIIDMAASLRPIALLVDVDVYSFDPGEFDALALSVGAHRVLVDEAEPIDRLVERLARSVTSSGRTPTPATDRPASERRGPPRSGIRWTAAARPRQTA